MLKPGDKVKFVSGGPAMTIASIEKGVARVCWFTNTKLREETFPIAVLKPTCSAAQREANDRIRKAKKRAKR